MSVLLGAGFARAQDAQGSGLPFQPGPATFAVGDGLAEIDLPEGYLFLDAAGSVKLMEVTQNPPTGQEVATFTPAGKADWFVIFEWSEIGWVDDRENDLDPDELLGSIREGTEASNEYRREHGWTEMHIAGWQEAPHYDERTHNLTWAIIGESGGSKSINRVVKLLGRRGVMTATLVAGPEDVATAATATDALLEGYRFRTGNTYAEFLPGKDRLAEVGLAALVVGGGGAALVKSGLLARFWKLIVLGVVTVAGGIGRLFRGTRAEDQPITRV